MCNLQPSGLQQHSSEHVISRSKQLLLAVFLQKAHLNPFKSKAVTVSTVHYRHSSMASASMLRCPAQQGGSVKWAHSNTNMQPTACSLQEGQKQRGAREAPQSFSLVWRVQTLPPLQIKAFLLVWMLCLLAESGMRRGALPAWFTPAEAAAPNRRRQRLMLAQGGRLGLQPHHNTCLKSS